MAMLSILNFANPAHSNQTFQMSPSPFCSSGKKCGYQWSADRALEPAEKGRQRCETALTTDANGQVWLAYLDTHYRQTARGIWLAWPRDVVLWKSGDQGKTFTNRHTLSISGNSSKSSEGDPDIASDNEGNVFATWVQYNSKPGQKWQKIYLQRFLNSGDVEKPLQVLPWVSGEGMKHDQSHVTVDKHGVVHVLGRDIKRVPRRRGVKQKQSNQKRLLYAQSRDNGRSFTVGQRLPDPGGSLPQMVVTSSGLIIAAPRGYLVSYDEGKTFSTRKVPHPPFGDKLVRMASSRDGRIAYVVGDSRGKGIWINRTSDAGRHWSRHRVDDGSRASAHRYPIIHVDANNRLHVAWIDDRTGSGAVYHAFSDDNGLTFSTNTRVSSVDFPFPADAPPPPPSNQKGTWIGDYNSMTTVDGKVIIAWADQRSGHTISNVYLSIGTFGSARSVSK